MGCFHNCLFQHGSQQFIIVLLFLLISSVTHFRFMAEGRTISRQLIEASEAAQMGRKENAVMARSMIGSRPPRCDKKCNNCGHCEAVQVPVAPQLIKTQLNAKSGHHLYANPSIAYSRGDDLSNYKPMSWKCKCGDFLFNP